LDAAHGHWTIIDEDFARVLSLLHIGKKKAFASRSHAHIRTEFEDQGRSGRILHTVFSFSD